MTPLLCKVGLHKWRNYGERVLIVWKEPSFIIGTKKEIRKYVFSERESVYGVELRRRDYFLKMLMELYLQRDGEEENKEISYWNVIFALNGEK